MRFGERGQSWIGMDNNGKCYVYYKKPGITNIRKGWFSVRCPSNLKKRYG